MLLVQPSECCSWDSGDWEMGTPPHHQLSAEGQACAAKTWPASSDNLMRIHPLFHCAEPLTHPLHTVNYIQCRKQLLTILFIFVVLFVLHQWSTTLNNVLIFLFSPQGFSSTASEGFTSLDDLSLPTSLWGQCHLPVTDGKQTGTSSKWVTQSHAAFCHLWGDGKSASSKRSLPLSHYVCYSLSKEQSKMKHSKPHLRCPYHDWKREGFSEQPLGLTPVTSLP